MSLGAEWVAVGVSAVALLVSAGNTWYAHLRPFNLTLGYGTPRLNLYSHTKRGGPDGHLQTRWTAIFDLGVSMSNTGKRSGEVTDVRLRLRSAGDGYEFPNETTFYPEHEVDFGMFQRYRASWEAWTRSAVTGPWQPRQLRGDDQEHIHVVLQPRIAWSKPRTGQFEILFEVRESGGTWTLVDQFELRLVLDAFAQAPLSLVPGDPRLNQGRETDTLLKVYNG